MSTKFSIKFHFQHFSTTISVANVGIAEYEKINRGRFPLKNDIFEYEMDNPIFASAEAERPKGWNRNTIVHAGKGYTWIKSGSIQQFIIFPGHYTWWPTKCGHYNKWNKFAYNRLRPCSRRNANTTVIFSIGVTYKFVQRGEKAKGRSRWFFKTPKIYRPIIKAELRRLAIYTNIQTYIYNIPPLIKL